MVVDGFEAHRVVLEGGEGKGGVQARFFEVYHVDFLTFLPQHYLKGPVVVIINVLEYKLR